MDIELSTILKSRRMLVHILSILVILAMAFPAAGHATAQEAQPRMVVSITHDWFQAEEFSPGGTLNVKIYEEQGGPLLWEENRTADESGFMVVEPWQHPVDLKPGNYLVISDGTTTKALILEAVTLDVFDPSMDYLAGTAPPAPGGRLVWVGTGNDSTGCGMDVIADPVSGAWEADFSTQPCDVTEDMWAAAQVFDEDGDASEGNLPLTPIFAVFPEWEAIEGSFWTQDATVHLEIDDPSTPESPDHVQDAQVVPLPWNPNDVWVRFDFAGVYDVKPGDVVTLSEGTISGTYTVENLAITAVNEVEDTVSGTAEAGETIYVWPHATGQQVEATAGSEGAWEVDFTGIFDLVPGECGRSEVRDGTGNSTAVDWCIPNPRFSAFPEWESIEGWEWPLGANIHLTIDDPATGANPDYEDDQQVVVTPWDPNVRWVQFNFNGQYDMKVGDVVTLTDGLTPRTHTVRNLSITGVNQDTEIVSGMADEGATVYVWPHATGQQLEVTAGAGGIWQADFTGIFDIAPGEGGRAEIRDDAGNATAVDWYVPNPHFAVFPEWEYIEGWEWPVGAVVHLTIDDPATLQSPDYSGDEPVVPLPWDPNQLWVTFNFANTYDMKPGDLVTLDDGVTARTHTVRNLGITAVDELADTVAGTAEVGETVHVWPHATGQQLQVIADAAGVWQADFSGVFDLVGGEGGRSEVRDEQGNSTAVDWYVPNPRFVVFPEWEWFDGLDWPDGATVNITVDGKPECSTAQESWGFFFNGSFGEGCDIVFGDQVTFAAGDIVLTHTVQILAVTEVDLPADTVDGTAGPGAIVQVWPHETGQTLEVMAIEDGRWQADFTGIFDLVEGSCGRSQIVVGVNATAVDWCGPKPWMIAFPENEAVEAWEWPEGMAVTLTIDQAPGFMRTEIAQVTPWGDPRTYIRFDFAEEYDLQSGDTVTLTAEDGTTRSHVVENLSVTGVNADADTVQGTADPGAIVRLWPHGHDQTATLQTAAGEEGFWLADFASVGFNLVQGIGGRSEVRDEGGNSTAVDWGVPVVDWQQINDSGFGDPQTTGVSALEVFKGQLYAGSSNGSIGGQVWRLGSNGLWNPVSEAGFGGGAPNPTIIDLAVFNGRLYAGTGWNVAPGQVWRSTDGTRWQTVTTDGFGNEETTAISNFVVFKDRLYAGTGSLTRSAEIWRSDTGNSGSWKQVASNRSAFPSNVTGFSVFKGSLYAAIEPSSGGGASIQVWQSMNGSDWTTVVPDGFGDAGNISVGGFAQVRGYLYLGTRNEETGAQLWRTLDGVHWEQVVGNGFGDRNNVKIESLLVSNDILYAATFNSFLGLQVWRSADGMTWEQIAANGFGDSSNYATLWNNATVEYQGKLVMGTWNTVEGGEIWRYTP